MALALDGSAPHLVDEWQLAPFLWDSIRHLADRADGLGRFILTGSSDPADTSEIFHSGAGRFAWMKMRPMSLWESGESSGSVSLERLFAGGDFPVSSSNGMTLADVAFTVCRGGWPRAIGLSRRAALQQVYNYVDALVLQFVQLDAFRHDVQQSKRERILGTVWAMLPVRTDVNLQMVKDGFAWHYKHFDSTPSYAAAETAARTAKRGLWKERGMRLEGVPLHVDRKSAAGTMEISQPSWIASSDCLQVTTIPDLSPNRLAAEARPPNSLSMLSSVSS